MTPYSLYLHIPFCTHRCAYCDFNTYAGQEDMIPAYGEALCKETMYVGRLAAERRIETKAHTIFFGGGTPSLLSPLQYASIFKSIRTAFAMTPDCEITIEANPGTVSYEALCQLRKIGINRISFGVQSANPVELRMLERTHSFFDVIEAVTSARKAGFDNLNLDLIYGLPEQTLTSWQSTVQRILNLHPEHISAYALTLEHGTPFGRWASKGMLPLPDPDLAAEMYEWAGETLEAHGYLQYEISNWARRKDEVRRLKDEAPDENSSSIPHLSSFACRHNLQYWRSLPYLAFGAGAHGYAGGYRYSNALRIKTYIDRLNGNRELEIGNRSSEAQISTPESRFLSLPFPLTPATVNHHKQSLKDDMSEYMINNLRLVQAGVSEADFRSRFGSALMDVYGMEIEELIRLGLLEETPSPFGRGTGVRVRLTRRGRLLGNQVFMRFV